MHSQEREPNRITRIGARSVYAPRERQSWTGGSSISGFAIGNDGSLTLLTPGGRTGDLGAGANPLDIDFAGDGRFLYVLKNGTGTVGAFAVNQDGTLTPLADTPGLVAQAGFMGLVAF